MCKSISSPISSWCDRMQLLILGQLIITCRTQFAKQVFPRFRMPLLAREYIIACKDPVHTSAEQLVIIFKISIIILFNPWVGSVIIINNMETFLSLAAI